MTVFQKADLLVNVRTLDDVATREGFRLPEVEGAFVNLVEAAALLVAEQHFADNRQLGANHVDWNGSRLQFWASYSRQVYELLIFQFDYQELPPLVCCASQDFVFGARSLTAQFAIMRDGRRVHIELLPESQDRRRQRAPVATIIGTVIPTLHRVMEAIRGTWSRVRALLWSARKLAGDACRALARRCDARIVSIRDWIMRTTLVAALCIAYGRVLALVGCSAEKCDGSARNPLRQLGALWGSSGLLAGASNLFSRLRGYGYGFVQKRETRNVIKPENETKSPADTIICRDPISEDHLAALHGFKPQEPADAAISGTRQWQSAADATSRRDNT